ncbi:hypothetical protein EUX98_g3361 [Antrodiella citrinella]|uniref:Uncharacterized protein n=1 Tax=Antrodiella citrinella TaxID=2447956 RepID=A0A4S4MZ83_9APHY|nr:hypothetical protein EUX98_g3361 [Antrodiella citrinella]
MIIRLIPHPPLNVVLFTVSFNTKLPSVIQLPQFYSNQLGLLSQHELDRPISYHCLDKATWLIACLHEVSFDLSIGNGLVGVRCTFIDGDVKEWTFSSDRCSHDLVNVCRDVRWSAMQAERERYERYSMHQIPEEVSQPKKHKKQRSLLMSLVSSLVPSTSPVRNRESPPPPARRCPPPPPPSNLSSQTLRRRARSTLVDSFRRFVVTGLSQYFPSGSYGCGYVPFMVRSMLRRNEDRMAALLHEAGLGSISIYGSRTSPQRPLLRGQLSDSPFYDDEEAEETSLESRSTDTDGSSVHTPTDAPGCSTFLPTPPMSPHHPRKGRPSRDLPRTPTPPSPVFTPHPQIINNINALNHTSHQLQHLLSTLAQSRVVADQEDKQVLAVLEVKSRRRAWSNRDLLGGARACDVGFGMPEHSSPLGRSVISADEVEVEDASTGDGWNSGDLVKRMRELNLRKTPSRLSLNSVNRLFPVSEEDEEDHVDLQTTSRVALDLFSDSDSENDHEQGHGYGYGEYEYAAEDFDGVTPSVRLIEDAENGLLTPLSLPLTPSPTPPPSPSTQSSFSDPPPRRERKRSMMNRPTLPVLDVEMSLRQDPDLPAAPAAPPASIQVDQRVFYPQQQTQYHYGHHPLMQTTARYRFDPQTKIEIFDVSYDDDLESSYSSYSSYPSIAETEEPEEFTLGMDLSPPSQRHMTLPLPVTAYNPDACEKHFDRDEWIVGVGQGVEVGVEVGVRYHCA